MKSHENMDDEKLLRLAALSVHENAVAEYEALEDGKDLISEKEIQKQWNAVMKEHRKRNQRGLFKVLRSEVLRKVAAVIAALSVLGGGVTATVVAVNPQIRDGFDTDFADHSVFSIIFSDKRPEIPEEWDEKYYPTYMPDGFEYVRMEEYKMRKELIFQNKDKTLHFIVYPTEVNNGVNTENMMSKELVVNGVYTVLYVNDEDSRSILTMKHEDCVIRIGGPIQSTEAILIAESIRRDK